MKIQRIDIYDDPRFTKEALYQHGCYLVDDEPYEIVIVSKNEAVICGKDRSVYCDVIVLKCNVVHKADVFNFLLVKYSGGC